MRWDPHYHCDRQDVIPSVSATTTGTLPEEKVPVENARGMGDSRSLIYPHCGHEMSKIPQVPEVRVVKIITVFTNSQEVRKILECLKRNNATTFDKVEVKAS